MGVSQASWDSSSLASTQPPAAGIPTPVTLACVPWGAPPYRPVILVSEPPTASQRWMAIFHVCTLFSLVLQCPILRPGCDPSPRQLLKHWIPGPSKAFVALANLMICSSLLQFLKNRDHVALLSIPPPTNNRLGVPLMVSALFVGCMN